VKSHRAGDPPGVHRPGSNVTVTDALERKLYVIRKRSGHAIQALKLTHGKEFYVPSMSAAPSSTRACCWPTRWAVLPRSAGSARVSALALVHQRFSTNTFPTWDLAHPFRLIAHNGEINTLAATSTGCARASRA
jgi:glutamate synthase (NADPH/NADH) large chain